MSEIISAETERCDHRVDCLPKMAKNGLSAPSGVSVNHEFITNSSRIPDFDRRFGDYKNLQSSLLWRFKMISNKIFENMDSCGRTLWFALLKHKQTGDKKLHLENMFTCKNRFCPLCNWRRSRKLGIQSYKALQLIYADNPTYRYLLLTLTVKNPLLKDTKKTIERMNKGWNNLIMRKPVKKILKGWSKALEVVIQSSDNRYSHPHFHALLIVPSYYFKVDYISQSDWANMWQSAIGADYSPSVDVRVIKPKNDQKDAIASAVSEAIKYPVKNTDITTLGVEPFELFYNELKRVKMISFGGIFKETRRKLKLDDVEKGDLSDEKINLELFEYMAKLQYHYDTTSGQYYLKNCINSEGEVPS